MREVYAGYGNDAAMGYKFRARIVERKFRKGWPWKRYTVTKYMYIIDRHFMSWEFECRGQWTEDKQEAVDAANRWLDRKSAGPSGEVI